ncbi:MAG: hypothetical protein IJF70_03490 [Opitutales bacterium]|nr:hypothetical protein [Opitutales bacterium]
MKKILIITPTIFEAEPIFSELGSKEKLKVGDTIECDSIVGIVSGIGCNASAERIKNAIEKHSPDIIILAGFCGACDKHLKNGDLVYETSSPALNELAKKLCGASGKIACVEKIADTTKKMELGESGFVGVEMELDFFKNSINSSNADFIHLRWISDSLDSDIPPDFFESTMNKQTGELNLSVLRLIKSLITSPSLVIKLARFGSEIAPAKKKYAQSTKDLIKILKETF